MDIKLDSLSPARKKILLAAAILLIIALVIAGILRLTGSSDSETSAASGIQSSPEDQSAGPQSVAKTITPQSAGPANASGSMGTATEAGEQAQYVANTLWNAYADPEQAQATDLSSVLTESALEEFDAQALEWSRDGTHAEGTPTLENPQIISDDGAGNVTVSVCVDSSNVRLLNDAGTALTDETRMTRALTYFQFVKEGENWKLAGFSFPDDPTC
jgi:putative membrane protein